MGFDWPSLNAWCGVLPLRQGVACSAALGGMWGGAHAAVYCAPATALAVPLGAQLEPLRRAHGALGVLLLAAHALLAAAARRSDRAMCALYVRALPWLCGAALLVLGAAAALAATEGRPALAGLIFTSAITVALVSLYFNIIVANFGATIRS